MYNPKECINCQSLLKTGAKFCSRCGTPIPTVEENTCESSGCDRHKSHYLFSSDELYCDQCGKPTTLGRQVEANI